ncbi:MAG TPA: hypothetical protein VM346_10495 [Sphingomicrobium sp.]|nr:hypothetical protein [Sphingomicrobium sp.]
MQSSGNAHDVAQSPFILELLDATRIECLLEPNAALISSGPGDMSEDFDETDLYEQLVAVFRQVAASQLRATGA